MGFIDTIKDFRWDQAFLIVIAFIPYVDTEIIGIIPGLRDILPVENIHITRKSRTELLRLVVLIIIPILDGEIIQLLTGRDVNEVIADS